MTHIKTFENFLNEKRGKEWDDYKGEELAELFMEDAPDKDATGADLNGWLDDFAYDKDIEDRIDEYLASDIVDILVSNGYKKMSMKGIRVVRWS